MKKLFSVLVVGLLLMVYACGGGDDPKSVWNDMIDVVEDLINDMDKADNADDVVAAMEKAGAALEKLRPKMKAIEEKYPEFKGLKPGGKFPEELKDIEKRFMELMPKMMGMVGKMMQYKDDPKVQAAQKKLDEMMK